MEPTVDGRELVDRMRRRREASGSVGAILFQSTEAVAILDYIQKLENDPAPKKTELVQIVPPPEDRVS